jgi:hypothetical protein
VWSACARSTALPSLRHGRPPPRGSLCPAAKAPVKPDAVQTLARVLNRRANPSRRFQLFTPAFSEAGSEVQRGVVGQKTVGSERRVSSRDSVWSACAWSTAFLSLRYGMPRPRGSLRPAGKAPVKPDAVQTLARVLNRFPSPSRRFRLFTPVFSGAESEVLRGVVGQKTVGSERRVSGRDSVWSACAWSTAFPSLRHDRPPPRGSLCPAAKAPVEPGAVQTLARVLNRVPSPSRRFRLFTPVFSGAESEVLRGVVGQKTVGSERWSAFATAFGVRVLGAPLFLRCDAASPAPWQPLLRSQKAPVKPDAVHTLARVLNRVPSPSRRFQLFTPVFSEAESEVQRGVVGQQPVGSERRVSSRDSVWSACAWSTAFPSLRHGMPPPRGSLCPAAKAPVKPDAVQTLARVVNRVPSPSRRFHLRSPVFSGEPRIRR